MAEVRGLLNSEVGVRNAEKGMKTERRIRKRIPSSSDGAGLCRISAKLTFAEKIEKMNDEHRTSNVQHRIRHSVELKKAEETGTTALHHTIRLSSSQAEVHLI